MFRTMFIAAFLCLFFFGCAVKAPQQEKAESGRVEEDVKVKAESGRVEEDVKVKKEEKDPCEILIDEAVLKSRKTMKTVEEYCNGLRIEVVPMRNKNFIGTFYVRVYDTAGKKIRVEFRKPADPQ
jgi:hypothetical protein